MSKQPSIPAKFTISQQSLSGSSVHEAFLSGFASARAGKNGAAPRSLSNAEQFAFRHGRSYARAFRSKTPQQALNLFIETESMWIGSATYCIERDMEAGNYTPVYV